MLSASTCCSWRRKMSGSSLEPPSARWPWKASVTGSPTWTSPSASLITSGHEGARRLDAHAHRRSGRGAPCRPRARSDYLSRLPAAGGAPVRPLDDARGAVSSRRPTIPASVLRDGRGPRGFRTACRRQPLHPHALSRSRPLRVGVIYSLHARACIERGRVRQAEHYVGAVRDHAPSLACLQQG